MYILIAILIFGLLIAVHELGHFLAARLCGVTVHEFSIGMGPAIWQREGKSGTKYALRALPIGGFCALEGEEEDSDDPGSLNNRGFFQKVFIFAAGAGMNLVAGALILLCLSMSIQAVPTDQIIGLAPEFPYQGEDGLMPGDVIYKVDGWRVRIAGDARTFIAYARDGGMDIEVIRDGRHILLQGLERRSYTGDDGKSYTGFGIYLGYTYREAGLADKLGYAWDSAVSYVQTVWFSLYQLLSGGVSVSELNGPVGIVTTINEVGAQSPTLRAALVNIASLAALIAVNLAVMNLLPLPALDGGKIFFLVVNALLYLLCKRQIPARYEGYVHLVGLALLMALMVFVTFQDVARLFA